MRSVSLVEIPKRSRIPSDASPLATSPLLVAAALGSIVILGLVLRRWGWENWSYWLDESLQLFVASQPTKQIIALLRNERNHPPLDYLLTHMALKVSASPLFLRWVPTLFSVAALPLIFRRAGGSRRPFASLGAALALAVIPLAVHQGQELRAYAAAFLWVAVADVARTWHAEAGRKRALALQGIASVAAVYCLYISFLPLAASWALDAFESRGPEGRSARLRLVWIPAITIIAFLPWLFAVSTNLTRPNEIPAPSLSPKFVAELLVGFVADCQPGLRYAAAGIFIWALAAVGLFVSGRRGQFRAGIEILAIVVGMVVFLKVTNHWFEIRYFFFALWPLALLMGEGIGTLERAPAKWRIPTFAFAMAVLTAVEVPGLLENARWGRMDWRQPAQYLGFQHHSGRGGPVVPADWWSYMLLNAQRLDGELSLSLMEPCLNRDQLSSALKSIPEGWIACAQWGGSETGALLQAKEKPWALFARADNVRIYRFEHGRIVPP
jgi:hypothetical protein